MNFLLTAPHEFSFDKSEFLLSWNEPWTWPFRKMPAVTTLPEPALRTMDWERPRLRLRRRSVFSVSRGMLWIIPRVVMYSGLRWIIEKFLEPFYGLCDRWGFKR